MCNSVSGVAPYGSDRVVLTDTGCKRITVFSLVSGEVEIMAGTGTEGNSDSTLQSQWALCRVLTKQLHLLQMTGLLQLSL